MWFALLPVSTFPFFQRPISLPRNSQMRSQMPSRRCTISCIVGLTNSPTEIFLYFGFKTGFPPFFRQLYDVTNMWSLNFGGCFFCLFVFALKASDRWLLSENHQFRFSQFPVWISGFTMALVPCWCQELGVTNAQLEQKDIVQHYENSEKCSLKMWERRGIFSRRY